MESINTPKDATASAQEVSNKARRKSPLTGPQASQAPHIESTRPTKRPLLPTSPQKSDGAQKRHTSHQYEPEANPFAAGPPTGQDGSYSLSPPPVPRTQPMSLFQAHHAQQPHEPGLGDENPTAPHASSEDIHMAEPLTRAPIPDNDGDKAGQPPHITIPPQSAEAVTPVLEATPTSTYFVEDAHLAKNGIFSSINGLKRTATPLDGFPIPQLGASVWRNIPPAMKGRWQAKKGPKLWARLHRAGYASDLSAQALGIRGLIQRFADAPDVLVSTPIAETLPTGKYSPPWHFLVSGISQHVCDRLVGIQVIATEAITIFTLPFIETLPKHIGTLERFSLGDTEQDIAVVVKAVQSNLEANPHIATFVNSHTPNANATTVPRAYASIRVTTLQIQDSNFTQHTGWNVYCDDPPPMSIDSYFQWTALIRDLSFPTEDFGSGCMRTLVQKDRGTTIDRQFHCGACKSTDHPVGLCPFPNLEGWLGPTPATEDHGLQGLQGLHISNAPPPRGRGRGRGNIRRAGGGRGRGRG